jgi:hypothetical protein
MEKYISCKRVDLTYPDLVWKPMDVIYLEQESRLIHNDEMVRIQERTVFAYESHDEEKFINGLKRLLRDECEDGCEISPVTSD